MFISVTGTAVVFRESSLGRGGGDAGGRSPGSYRAAQTYETPGQHQKHGAGESALGSDRRVAVVNISLQLSLRFVVLGELLHIVFS